MFSQKFIQTSYSMTEISLTKQHKQIDYTFSSGISWSITLLQDFFKKNEIQINKKYITWMGLLHYNFYIIKR